MGRVVRFGQVFLFCTAILAMAAATMQAQDALQIPSSPEARLGGPQDWSNRHVIYTRNGSVEDMLKLRDDPRFLHSVVQHYLREHRGQFELSGSSGTANTGAQQFGEFPLHQTFAPTPRSGSSKHPHVDWSFSLGPTAGMAAGETPAVYVANYSSPSCTADFAVYTLNATPTVSTQANLVGINNLYTTGAGNGFCSGTGPTLMFSYAIGTGASALSPVLSLDGTKVAWIESPSATTSVLHITTWVANQGGSAVAPVAVTGTFSSGSCTPSGSSCDDAINYTSSTYPGCSTAYSAGNGHSDLYVDYASNSGFISANNGLLYHIKNIFSSTVAPSVDFCIPVNTTFETTPSSAMSGPVYDPILNEVFISDSEKLYGYTVNATATTPNFSSAGTPYTFGSSYSYPTGPGPLLDMFNGYLYVFSSDDVAGKTSVTQVATSLSSGTPVELGPKNTNTNPILFYGAFDNNYFTNGPKSALSTLYSCGTDPTTTTEQDLFSISFTASTGVVNTTPAMSNNKNINPSGTAGICSPLTEFYDGTNDRLFVGMGQPGASTGSNVVTMWNINSQLTNTSGSGGTLPTYSAEATGYQGGASGIAADNNDSGTAQAESIYFSTEEFGAAPTAVTNTTAYNLNGIDNNGHNFSCTGGLDNDGNAYSNTLLGGSVTWNGVTFTMGPSNNNDAWSNTTITVPSGNYNTLIILAAAVNVTSSGINESFTVNYTDGSSTTLTQNFSDWFNPLGFNNESIAKSMAYRNTCNGGEGTGPFDIYGYSFAINPNKKTSTITLPATRDVVFLAAALANNCGGADYCAVKLTQVGLQ